MITEPVRLPSWYFPKSSYRRKGWRQERIQHTSTFPTGHSITVTVTSSTFLGCARHIPTFRPLQLLLLLPKDAFPRYPHGSLVCLLQIFIQMSPSLRRSSITTLYVKLQALPTLPSPLPCFSFLSTFHLRTCNNLFILYGLPHWSVSIKKRGMLVHIALLYPQCLKYQLTKGG